MKMHRSSALPVNRTSLGPRAHQRGSVLVVAGVAMLAVVALLGAVDLGYLFYMKREFQKTADLSALAGVQQLEVDSCVRATSAAVGNADRNLPKYSLTAQGASAAVECGRWDPTKSTIGTPATAPDGGAGGVIYFGQPLNDASGKSYGFNAIRVTVQHDVPGILPFTGTHQISVNATAMVEEPLAVFTVGSKLAVSHSETAPVCALLKIIGLNACNFDIAGYNGLAQVKITPSGLLQALGIPVSADIGVGELNALLSARSVELGDLLNAIVTVAGQSGLVGANLDIVKAIEAQLNVPSLAVQLGSTDTKNGLFALIEAPSASSGSALNVELNALDVLTAAVGVGTSGHAATTALNLDLLGVSASAKVSIIEPPSIGIGGVGTKAYTAQVRLYAKVETKKNELLGGLLGLLGTSINLPVVIDVVSSQGTLTAVNCVPPPKTATISVDSSLLKACIGQMKDENIWQSTKDTCNTNLEESTDILTVLGIPLLRGQVQVNPLAEPPESVTLAVGETKSVGENQLALGDTVSELVDQLLALVLAQTPSDGPGGSGTELSNLPPDVATKVADKYLTTYQNNVDAVANHMDQDGLNWSRPCGLLGLGTCTMPDAWNETIVPTTCNSSCRTALINGLQTTASGGLLSGILNGVGDLLSTLLTGSASHAPSQNLLQSILMPVVNLLKPLLNAVGATLANLLNDLMGIQLGVTDVNLRSLSCGAPRLVY